MATITNVAVGGVILVGIALTYICHVSSNFTKVIKEASALANSVRGIEQRLETFSGIKKRIDELKNITEKLESRAKKSFNRLKKIKNFDCDNDRHVRIFQETAILMKALINLINTPILDKQGNVSQEGLNIIETTKKLIKNTELGK